jgi:hypothetical protein
VGELEGAGGHGVVDLEAADLGAGRVDGDLDLPARQLVAMRAKSWAPPKIVSRPCGNEETSSQRRLPAWALANIRGANVALAAATPAFFRNSRRFIEVLLQLWFGNLARYTTPVGGDAIAPAFGRSGCAVGVFDVDAGPSGHGADGALKER